MVSVSVTSFSLCVLVGAQVALATACLTAVIMLIYNALPAEIKLFYSATSAPLPRKAGAKADEYGGYTLVDLIKRKVPALYGSDAKFRPVWWLSGGNAQTIYCSVGDFSKADPITYERKLVRVPDGGTLALDITPPFAAKALDDTEPVLFVTHGLTGGSHESYVRAALSVLTSPELPKGRRFRAVVMNSRGCNGSPVTTPRLYTAGETDDIRSAILWICHTLPRSPIFGLGFSLGANALTKYAGEEGTNCPLSGLVSCANVWDFVRGSPHIEYGTLMNRYVYDFVLGGALRTLLYSHRQVFLSNPKSRLSVTQLEEFFKRGYVRLREYDEFIACPLYGFKGAMDYYSAISSCRVVDRISIPCLAINSEDDPIVTKDNIPMCQILQSPWVIQALTKGGGHMGWFETPRHGGSHLGRWYVKPASQFLMALLECDLPPRPKPKVVGDTTGKRIRHASRSDIGFEEVEADTVTSGMGESKLFTGW